MITRCGRVFASGAPLIADVHGRICRPPEPQESIAIVPEPEPIQRRSGSAENVAELEDTVKETLQDLKTRRSVRSFLKKQISDEELNAILEAGTYAPTGMGMQSPIIVVIQNPETIAELSRLNARVMGNPDADPFYGAPTLLVVLADKNRSTHVEDGSLVMGNLLNAAHAIGVDSCWIHRAREVFASPEVQKYRTEWGIGDEYEGIGNCILGYADGELPVAKPRKKDYIIRV